MQSTNTGVAPFTAIEKNSLVDDKYLPTLILM